MFNKQAPTSEPPEVPSDPAEDLQARVEAIETALRERGELPDPLPVPKVFVQGSTFGSRKAVAQPRRGPRLASLGVSKERVDDIRRGRHVSYEVEVETLVEVGHGNRMYRHEIGTGVTYPVNAGR